MTISYIRVILHHENKFLTQRTLVGEDEKATRFLGTTTAVVPSFHKAKQILYQETGIGDVRLVNTTSYLTEQEHLFTYLSLQTVSYRPPDFSKLDLTRFHWCTKAELPTEDLTPMETNFIHEELPQHEQVDTVTTASHRLFVGLGNLSYFANEGCWRGRRDFSGVFVDISVLGDASGLFPAHADTMRQVLVDLTAVYNFGLTFVEKLAKRMAWFTNSPFLNWEFTDIRVLDPERPSCYTLHYYEYQNDIYGNWVVYCNDGQMLFAKRTQT